MQQYKQVKIKFRADIVDHLSTIADDADLTLSQLINNLLEPLTKTHNRLKRKEVSED